MSRPQRSESRLAPASMLRSAALALLPVLLTAALPDALGQQPEERQYTVRIYWTDARPVLDGQMQDPCWQNAEAIGDFRMFQKPGDAATEQTEVRLCYDADHLYVHWRLHESRMDKLAYGPPEDMRDILDFNGDVAELFLDPGKTRKRKIQFCASPLGTRYDGSGKKGANFNPEWNVKPLIGPAYWTLEMAIPFAELIHRDEFIGTPQPGDEWGIQFCRDQAHLHEWSQWKPTPRSFHETDKFGTAVFMGRKQGPQMPRVELVSDSRLWFGRGALRFELKPASPLSESEWQLSVDGTEQHRERRPVPQTGALAGAFHLADGGVWDARMTLYERDRKLYAARTFAVLPNVVRMLQTVRDQTDRAEQALQGFEHPAKPELADSIRRVRQDLGGSLVQVGKADDLTAADWGELVAAAEAVRKRWDEVEFDVHLIQHYPRDAGNVVPFAVGCAGPDEKVYRNTRYRGSLDEPVRLAAAGGEYESFQLVVIPFWRQLDNVTVSFSGLEGVSGHIPAAQFTHHLVDYVQLEGLDPDDRTMNSCEPDILWPGKPFAVPRGEVRAVWVDVLLPRGTAAGEYVGSIEVSAEGRSIHKPVRVHSYGFDLPKTATLDNNFWYGPTDYTWGRFYGAGHYGDIEYTPAMYEEHARTLSRYRVTCFADSVLTMSPHFTIYREPDGHFSFDFSKWEEFIRIGLKYGSNAYRGALSCNLGAMYIFRQDRQIVDRATGETVRIKDVMGDWFEQHKQGKAYWDTHPLYRDYLRAYIEFMKQMGILDMASWEIYDEPNSNARWLDMIRHHKFLREYAPELKLMNYGVEPLCRKAGKTALGLIDIWAPHLTGITPECLRTMQQRRAEFEEQFWFYTCGERRDKNGNHSPYLYYHRSYLGPRIHAWFAWKLKADGILIYAMSSVPEANIKLKHRDQQWPATPWSDGKSRGCGTLIYPGPNFELIPGMRLASIRDGLEDYEYFAYLHKRRAYLDPDTDGRLLEIIEDELEVEPSIISSHYVWTKNREELEQKRQRLAQLIAQVSRIIDAK